MNLSEANKIREAIAMLRHKVDVLESRISQLESLGMFHVEHPVPKRPVGRPRKT